MTPAAYLDRHQDDLVLFLQKLVRLRTVNPPGENYGEITTLLAGALRDVGASARRIAVPKSAQRALQPGQMDHPRYNVLGWLNARAKKTIHFNAHFDVVPVSGSWRHGDPFHPAVDRGWIYGRGTADMKGAIASFLFALQALRATGTRPLCNVEVSFTADEETDSELGAGWLVRHAQLRADYALVGEGGEADLVCCGHNGVVWLEVDVHGRAAHGSTPEQGINALEKMAALVLALEDYKRTLARRKFRAPDGVVMRPTINVGGVFASGPGGKINTVPSAATFSIDRRVLAVETAAAAERELRAFLQRAAARIPQCRITIRKVSENTPCYHAPQGAFFAAAQESVARVRRRPAGFMVSTGFNDMHFFAHHLKIPTLGYGPSGRDYHAIDERARIKDLVQSAQIYARLLTTFAG